jgi:hypothetical protein
MGQFRHAETMFRGVNYNKFPTPMIKVAMEQKIIALKSKVAERRGRVTRLMSDHRITSEMLADMIIQYMKDQQEGRARMSYSNSVRPQSEGAQAPKTDVVDVPAGGHREPDHGEEPDRERECGGEAARTHRSQSQGHRARGACGHGGAVSARGDSLAHRRRDRVSRVLIRV